MTGNLFSILRISSFFSCEDQFMSYHIYLQFTRIRVSTSYKLFQFGCYWWYVCGVYIEHFIKKAKIWLKVSSIRNRCNPNARYVFTPKHCFNPWRQMKRRMCLDSIFLPKSISIWFERRARFHRLNLVYIFFLVFISFAMDTHIHWLLLYFHAQYSIQEPLSTITIVYTLLFFGLM